MTATLNAATHATLETNAQKAEQWGCDDIEEVVAEAGEAIAGIDVDDLRRSAMLRQEVSEQLRAVAVRLGDTVGEVEGGDGTDGE